MRMIGPVIAMATVACNPGTSARSTATTEARRLRAAYAALPLGFEANHGQTDPEAKFLARGRDHTVFLTASGAVLAFNHTNRSVRIAVRGGREPSIVGGGRQRAEAHYLIGADPSGWYSAETYSTVTYAEVYPGIDLVFHGHQQQLEYDFVIAAGRDPGHIALAIDGADRVALDDGDLVIGVAGREIRQHRALAYQDVAGERRGVDVEYVVRGPGELGFRVGAYDRSQPLVIDPVLTYATYLGGTDDDESGGIAVDAGGNIYLTGTTTLTHFPTKDPLQPASGGVNDAFVAKLDAGGTALVYSTYLGGTGGELGNAIAVDASGNAYIAGITQSSNFPTKQAAQATYGGAGDAFVAKLDPTGSTLVYATFLGGTTTDTALGVAADAAGNAYVCGVTNGAFPTTAGSVQPATGGNQDAFVAKLGPTGSILYATYLGGSGNETASGIATDGQGNAFVTGQTDSANFPRHNPLQAARGGGVDAFISKLDATGAALVYSTYLGGTGDDAGESIAVDPAGRAFVAGETSGGFPTTAGAYQRTYGGGAFDLFVTRLAAGGAALDYATYLGGASRELVTGIAFDSAGRAFVVGLTNGPGFPTTSPFQAAYGGGANDAIVSELDATGASLVFSSFLGGAGDDSGRGIAVDPAGYFYVSGNTSSTDFPTAGAYQSQNAGGLFDVFAASDRTPSPATDAGTADPTDAANGDHGDGGTTPGTMNAGCGCRSGGAPDGGLLVVLALGYLLRGRPRSRRVRES